MQSLKDIKPQSTHKLENVESLLKPAVNIFICFWLRDSSEMNE